ncbi:MAG TPA: response regulator [Kofleriaceae bacterium]
MGAHVLVVDDDPQILRMLSDVLTKRGFGVDTASDGEEAYSRALQHAPDLLVTDVMMPKLDGWSLVRKLRLEPKLANLPVIFLTAVATDDARVQAFRLGADDYVNKPFKFKDLVSRIEKVLTAKRPAATTQAGSGLAGDLAQIGLSTLLVLIEMERKTGALEVHAADGRAGSISTRDGKVVDAALGGANQPRGPEAVYVMLTWTAGRFEFVVRAVASEDRIKQSTTQLLLEGARLMDEAAAPEAVAQLDEEAIAEWRDEPTPMVAAAKLADLVRRSARVSSPPYAGHTLSPLELAALAAAPPAEAPKSRATTPSSTPPPAEEPKPRSTTPSSPPVRSAAPSSIAARSTPSSSPARTGTPSNPSLSAPSINAALEAAAESGVHALIAVDDIEDAAPEQAKPAIATKPPTKPTPDTGRRASPWWVVACLLVAGGGVATFAIRPKSSSAAPTADLRHDATAIAAAFDRGVAAAQMRADGLAAMPMLRAGIETDAATLHDMVTNEMMLEPASGETIEVFQLRGGAAASVLRLPADAAALAPAGGPAVRTDGKLVEVIAHSSIKNQQAAETGVLAVAVTVDLADAAAELAHHVQGATLTGLDHPVVLVPVAAGAPTTATQPINAKAAPNLALVANLATPAPTAAALPWLAPVRYACFALAGLLLIGFIAASRRR